jgi:predicted  nucleic acid-binding Zn-ribbon protein
MEKLNTLQINTASEALREALNNKKNEIGKKAIDKDLSKYRKEINKFNGKAVNLYNEALTLKNKIEKGTYLSLDMSDYNSYLSKLPKTIEDIKESDLIEIKGANYSNDTGKYKPELKEETKEVENFILGLKLGTALMADLQPLLNKINNIK